MSRVYQFRSGNAPANPGRRSNIAGRRGTAGWERGSALFASGRGCGQSRRSKCYRMAHGLPQGAPSHGRATRHLGCGRYSLPTDEVVESEVRHPATTPRLCHLGKLEVGTELPP